MTITLWERCVHAGVHLCDLTWSGAAVLLAFFGCGYWLGRSKR